MELISAAILSPFITAVTAFVLNKYLSNKPKLIFYYSHASSHKMPINSGYKINCMSVLKKPEKIDLDREYSEKIPLIIQYENDIFVYGRSSDGNSQLTQSSKPGIYKDIPFKEADILSLKDISSEIYNDIASANAHVEVMWIGTHEVIIRNAGNLPAKNVRVGHSFLPPSHNVWPHTHYQVISLPSGGEEILFPTIAPLEQVSISYLYSEPITHSRVNTYVKSDEALAKKMDMILSPNLSWWQKFIYLGLWFIGASTIVCFLMIAIAKVWK